MNYNQAMDYLLTDADGDDTSQLATPCSRYGYRSGDVAPIAYRHAVIHARRSGEPLTRESLEHSMSLAVNDHADIGRDIEDYAIELAGADIDAMVNGYLTCQLWAQRNMDSDDDRMLDADYGRYDIADEYVDTVADEFRALVAEHPIAVRMFLSHYDYRSEYADCQDRSALFGHDYYLTREHHGAGFWDRGLSGDLGRYLTDIAHSAGSAETLWDNGNGVLAA